MIMTSSKYPVLRKMASYFCLVFRGHGDSQLLIANLKVVIGDLSEN